MRARRDVHADCTRVYAALCEERDEARRETARHKARAALLATDFDTLRDNSDKRLDELRRDRDHHAKWAEQRRGELFDATTALNALKYELAEETRLRARAERAVWALLAVVGEGKG